MTSQHCFLSSHLPVPSSDGALIAFIANSHLHIRSVATADDVQIYDLSPGFDTSCRFIRWYRQRHNGAPTSHEGASSNSNESIPQRLLLAADARIIVYDITRPQLYAEISGTTTLTKLADVDFGWTSDEIMLFSDFGYKLQIWSLTSKRAVEVKDPKSEVACYSYRPNTGHLALLTRHAAHDILMILAPHSHEVLSTFELSTVDACGVDYSPDGNWLAVWDSASVGCRVIVLTADGHHFKTFSRPEDELTLGISVVRWSPAGDHLAIGDHDGMVTLLGKNTFTPRLSFLHTMTVEIPDGIIWQEELGPSRTRSYSQAKQPAGPPLEKVFQAKKRQTGVAIMEFSARGELLASTSSDTPSTLWVYSLQSSQPLTALIHHSPIKAIYWHPTLLDLLLIQCAISEPTIYMWKASWQSPRVFSLPLKAPVGRLRASWLLSDDQKIKFMLSNTDQSAIGQISHDGEDFPWHFDGNSFGRMGPEAMFDEGRSVDLSPIKMPADGFPDETPSVGLSTELGQTIEVDDTFHYRYQNEPAP